MARPSPRVISRCRRESDEKAQTSAPRGLTAAPPQTPPVHRGRHFVPMTVEPGRYCGGGAPCRLLATSRRKSARGARVPQVAAHAQRPAGVASSRRSTSAVPLWGRRSAPATPAARARSFTPRIPDASRARCCKRFARQIALCSMKPRVSTRWGSALADRRVLAATATVRPTRVLTSRRVAISLCPRLVAIMQRAPPLVLPASGIGISPMSELLRARLKHRTGWRKRKENGSGCGRPGSHSCRDRR